MATDPRHRLPETTEEVFDPAKRDPRSLAAQAYVWGFPLVAAAHLRLRRTRPDDPFAERGASSPGAPINNLGHQRRTSDPAYRVGVGANTDTLYSSAWLDLSDEPFVLELPRIPDRYYSYQFAHSDTSADVALGSRTHGEQLPPVFIHGPGYEGPIPDGMIGVASATRYLNMPGRILVDPADPADFAAVHQIQSQIRLRTLSRYRRRADGPNPVPSQRSLTPPTRSDPDLAFLHELGAVLREEVAAPGDAPLLEAFTAIGLSQENGFDEAATAPHIRRRLHQGLVDGARIVDRKSQSLGRDVRGWTINHTGPRFGSDHLLRAGVAKNQIYVTVPEDGLYPVASVDSTGAPLDGGHAYRIVFGPGAQPPVEAFWSITVYDQDGFLVPNPIGRYAVGDRTPGLRTAEDGSVAITAQHRRPGPEDESNWLPTPDSRFYMMMRLFVPKPAALDGGWAPPAIERMEHP